MKTKDYIVDLQGNFRFTKVGIKNQSHLLAKAGIDANNIDTYDEYIQARMAASHYFFEYIQEEVEHRLRDKPDTLEWQAIRSIVFNDYEQQRTLLDKIRIKQSLTIC